MKFDKKSIRPILNLQLASTEIEIFQNEVLRPVLKLQNDVMFFVFKNYCNKHKLVIDKESSKEKVTKQISQVFQNIGFRNLILGFILGQLTLEELKKYHSHESEFRKRITTMLKQRLLDNFLNT